MRRLVVNVAGRPAPQGSKRLGEHGQLREQSVHLVPWRGGWTGKGANRRYKHGAVGRAVYEAYAAAGVRPEQLPLFEGAIEVTIVFYVDTMPADPPDVDKLARATFDALSVCRVWEDDARVVHTFLAKRPALPGRPAGALIIVKQFDPRPLGFTAARRRARRLSRRWEHA